MRGAVLDREALLALLALPRREGLATLGGTRREALREALRGALRGAVEGGTAWHCGRGKPREEPPRPGPGPGLGPASPRRAVRFVCAWRALTLRGEPRSADSAGRPVRSP